MKFTRGVIVGAGLGYLVASGKAAAWLRRGKEMLDEQRDVTRRPAMNPSGSGSSSGFSSSPSGGSTSSFSGAGSPSGLADSMSGPSTSPSTFGGPEHGSLSAVPGDTWERERALDDPLG